MRYIISKSSEKSPGRKPLNSTRKIIPHNRSRNPRELIKILAKKIRKYLDKKKGSKSNTKTRKNRKIYETSFKKNKSLGSIKTVFHNPNSKSEKKNK